MTEVVIGNAGRDGAAYRGWFVGHFVDSALAGTEAVEVKWGTHALHETRARWATSKRATTMSMLIRGSIRLFFREHEALLSHPGDYVLWGPGVAHRWQIEADDTVVLTVRWPSQAGDVSEHD